MNLKYVGYGLLGLAAVVFLTDTKIKVRPAAAIPDINISTK